MFVFLILKNIGFFLFLKNKRFLHLKKTVFWYEKIRFLIEEKISCSDFEDKLHFDVFTIYWKRDLYSLFSLFSFYLDLFAYEKYWQ